jgi:hypothetical protein
MPPGAPVCPKNPSPVRRCGAPAWTLAGQLCRWRLDRGPCPRHASADRTRRCTATTKPARGEKGRPRCRAWPLVGSALCRQHQPEAMAQCRRSRAGRTAQAARARQHAPLRQLRAVLLLVLGCIDAELGGGRADTPALSLARLVIGDTNGPAQ